jgi:hypothetical protein
MEKMNINIDKTLDLLTATFPSKKENGSHLEVIEIDNNILFHVNPETNEVVMVQIYDFSVIKRKFIKHLMPFITKDSIRIWLNTLIASFKANKPKLAYNQ